MSRECAVGVAAGYLLYDLGVEVRVLVRVRFSLIHVIPICSGTHPVVTVVISTRVKRLESEADHLIPYSALGKECVVLYIHSTIRFHGVVLN
jgi:hypothetical protein